MEDSSHIAAVRPTAVIVDDDAAVRNSLRFFLEIEGYAVQTYSNASDLLKQPAFPARCCLIIDQRLPDLMGLDLLARLRQRDVTAPAILVTTNPSRALRAKAEAAGTTLIEKPLLTEALSQAIRSALSAA